MIAEDMQLNGVAAAPVVAAAAAPAPAPAAGRGRGRGRAMLTNARKPPPLASAVPVAMAVRLETVHRPTAIELAADLRTSNNVQHVGATFSGAQRINMLSTVSGHIVNISTFSHPPHPLCAEKFSKKFKTSITWTNNCSKLLKVFQICFIF